MREVVAWVLSTMSAVDVLQAATLEAATPGGCNCALQSAVRSLTPSVLAALFRQCFFGLPSSMRAVRWDD